MTADAVKKEFREALQSPDVYSNDTLLGMLNSIKSNFLQLLLKADFEHSRNVVLEYDEEDDHWDIR